MEWGKFIGNLSKLKFFNKVYFIKRAIENIITARDDIPFKFHVMNKDKFLKEIDNEKNQPGVLLFVITANGYEDMLELLVNRYGTSVFKQTYDLFLLASCLNHTNIFKFLVDNLNPDPNELFLYFLYAITNNNDCLIKYIIDLGMDVNNENGLALAVASYYKQINIVKLLMNHGFNVSLYSKNIKNNTLSIAAVSGDIKLIELLINVGYDVSINNCEPIKRAAQYDKLEAFKFFLSYHPDRPIIDVCFNVACTYGSVNIVNYFFDHLEVGTKNLCMGFIRSTKGHESDITNLLLDHANKINFDLINFNEGEALKSEFKIINTFLQNKKLNLDLNNFNDCNINHTNILAYSDFTKNLLLRGANLKYFVNEFSLIFLMDSVELIKKFIDNGATIKSKEIEIITYVCFRENTEVMEFLINSGLDIRMENDYALRLAMRMYDAPMIELLLNHGANMRINDDELVIKYTYFNKIDRIKFLIENGADINAQKSDALIVAIKSGKLDMVKFLVENGIDIHCQNNLAFEICKKMTEIDGFIPSDEEEIVCEEDDCKVVDMNEMVEEFETEAEEEEKEEEKFISEQIYSNILNYLLSVS